MDSPPGLNPLQELAALECVAGRGVRGDRLFYHQENYNGQITFFSSKVFEQVCQQLGVSDRSARAHATERDITKLLIISGLYANTISHEKP